MNLDTKGRTNRFVHRRETKAIHNQYRRKSNGGMGG